MTAGDKVALTIMERRLRHVAATAELVAKSVEGFPRHGDVLLGIAATLNEIGEKVEALIDAEPAA